MLSIEEKRRKVERWYTVDNFTACQYCDGMCDDSVRYAPAEQLTDEELAQLRK